MDIDKKFEELYEGWKKGKYTIKDKNGKILGTYSSGGKAQKAMDDLMQKGDYDKLEVSIVEEKEWHDGHEPQGGHDHYDEEEVEEKFEKEASSYFKKKKGKGEKSFGISRKKDNVRHGSSGYGKEEVEEGYKDLPPHLQKLIKKIEKKQKDWNKQNPGAKIQTLVYNPETGKPDIIVKETTMKLEDTVKQVVMGEHKGNKPHKHPHEDKVQKEDDDKDEPGTQGDNAEYQKKRKAVAKKFGVSDCSQLDGAKKKACYKALDDAHVADHEEQVELEKMKKEETKESKSFSKMFSHIKSLMQGK